jgi:hypothetical protein
MFCATHPDHRSLIEGVGEAEERRFPPAEREQESTNAVSIWDRITVDLHGEKGPEHHSRGW